MCWSYSAEFSRATLCRTLEICYNLCKGWATQSEEKDVLPLKLKETFTQKRGRANWCGSLRCKKFPLFVLPSTESGVLGIKNRYKYQEASQEMINHTWQSLPLEKVPQYPSPSSEDRLLDYNGHFARVYKNLTRECWMDNGHFNTLSWSLETISINSMFQPPPSKPICIHYVQKIFSFFFVF